MPVETDLMVPWVPADLSPVSPDLYDALTITLPDEINAFDEADLEEMVQGVASCPNPAEPLEPISSTVCIPYEQEGQTVPGDTSAGCDGSLLSYCVYYEATGTWRVHIVFSEGQALGSLLSLRLPGTVEQTSDDFGLKAEYGGDEFEESVQYTTTPISGLKIRTEPGGAGEEVTQIELREGTDDEQIVYAAAYDDEGVFIDDAWVGWATGDNAEATPDEGTQTTVTPITAGEDELSATHPDVSATAGINVLDPAPTEVKICLNGDCTGGIVDVILGGAATFDAVDQSNEPVEVEWSLDNDIGSLDTETGTSTKFTATSTGMGALSARFEGGEPGDSLSINVKQGDLETIRICLQEGGCEPITPPLTVTAGVNEEFFAAGYNEHGKFIGDQVADWSVTPETAGNFDENVFTPINVGGATITTDLGGTLGIEIEPGPFANLEIQNDDGDPIGGDLHIAAGDTLDLNAVGFDEFMNEIGPVSADWSVLGGIGEVDPETGEETVFTAMHVGSGRVKATSDGVSAETGLIHVIPGPLDDLIIQHGPSSGSPPVNSFLTTTDGDPSKEDRHWVLFAVGYDEFGNWIGPIENTQWEIDDEEFGHVTSTGGSTEFKPHTPGIVTVSATSTQEKEDGGGSAQDDTGLITIVHGALRVLKVQDAPDGLGEEIAELEMEAGDTQPMWAAGFDGDDNYVGDRPVNWTVDPACGELIEIPGLEESPAILFKATTVVNEDCFVTAHHEEELTLPGTDIELMVETTGQAGPITVNAGPGVDLTIRDEDGEVFEPDYTAGDQVTLIAEMADEYGNSVGDEVEAEWRVQGDCGSLDQNTGSRVIFEARTATEDEDDCRVFAEVETESLLGLIPQTLEADTGTITVAPQDSAASVKIRSQPDNQGIELTEITRTTDETQTVYAAAYDAQFNYIGDLETTVWSGPDQEDLKFEIGGGSSTLEPMKPGTVTLTATIHGATADLIVNMEVGALDHIEIRDDVGDVIDDGFSIDALAEMDLFAFGLDAKANEIGPLSVDWEVLGGCGTVDPASGDTTTFKAGVVNLPGCTVEATHEGLSQDVGDITVDTPLPETVQIRDAAGEEGEEVGGIDLEAGNNAVLHAAGFFDFTQDDGHEYIGDQKGTWSVIGDCGVFVDESGEEVNDPPTGTSTVTFQARNVLETDCQVKVEVDGIDGLIDDVTGLIDVSAGPLASLAIHHLDGGKVIDPVTVQSGYDHEFEAVGFDEFGNLRDEEGASWQITENPACGSFTNGGSTPSNTFVGDIALTCTIRAAISGIEDLAQIKVTPGDAHELQVLVQGNPPVIGGSVPAGEAFNVWVQVHDAAGNKVIGEDATVTINVEDPLATVGEDTLDGATRAVDYDRARFDDVRLYRSDFTLGRELTLEASADNDLIQPGSATLRIIAGDPFAIDVNAPTTVAIDDPAEVTLFVTDEWDNPVEDEEVVNVWWDRNSIFAQGFLVVEGDQVAPEPGQSVEAETRDGEVHAVLHTLSVDQAHSYLVNAEAGDAFGTSGPIQVALPNL